MKQLNTKQRIALVRYANLLDMIRALPAAEKAEVKKQIRATCDTDTAHDRMMRKLADIA